MKIFNKKDLITWVNCDKAIVGKKYYFSNTVHGMQFKIKNNSIHTLIRVDESLIDTPFVFENDIGECYSACALPAESVTEKKRLIDLVKLLENCTSSFLIQRVKPILSFI